MKRNTIILIVVALVALWYLFGRDNAATNDNSTDDTDTQTANDDEHGKGWKRDSAKFDQTEIFIPLDPNSPKNQLPQAVSLRQYAPAPQNQGEQGSCTGWASSYAARTILASVSQGIDPNNTAFSPSYTFNQEHGDGCNGAIMYDVLEMLKKSGTLPMADFPYNPRTCSRQPNSAERQQAKNHRILGFNRLTNGQDFNINMAAMKQNIAKGAPVLIGMPVGGSIEKLMQAGNQGLWNPSQRDYSGLEEFRGGNYDGSGLGGHAMCVIGYDDKKFGGAVEIQNSWGKEFGENGFFWMKYDDFKSFCMEAYGLFPMASAKADPNKEFQVSLGLPINKSDSYLTFRNKTGLTFETTRIFPLGTKFKVEITNTTPCYAYVIGQETDGSSYTLFPYTAKHSPYIGIVGTRIFPEKSSLQLDNIGNKDVIAILLSKEALDIEGIKNTVSQNRSGTYEAKVRQALGNKLIATQNLTFTTDQMINVSAGKTDKSVIAIVMEINKK
ncbi:MAG: peptidase C1 [Verrucomicrobia bacterium]|nr:peptidase C1 [Cytophagales bacterium]